MVRRILSVPGRRLRALLLATIFFQVAIPGIGFAQDSPLLRTAFLASAMQPGDVVRLDVLCRCGDAEPTARAFGRSIPLYALEEPPHPNPLPSGGGEGAKEGRWRGLIGIDLDTKPGAYRVTATLDRDNRTPIASTRLLHVTPKRFRTRRLRVNSLFVEPPAAVRDRIVREARLMANLFAMVTPRLWDGEFQLPVPQAAVSNFGTRSVFNGQPRSPHAGVDFASPTGTPIAAPGAGRVVLADDLYFTGNTVIVDHGQGLVSLFAHLSQIDVVKEDAVARGALLGLVGSTGRVTGPHLHWSIRLGGARVDPLSLVAVTKTTMTQGTKGR